MKLDDIKDKVRLVLIASLRIEAMQKSGDKHWSGRLVVSFATLFGIKGKRF
jgi:hypothetical protein